MLIKLLQHSAVKLSFLLLLGKLYFKSFDAKFSGAKPQFTLLVK